MLNITKNNTGNNALTVGLEGRLDTNTAPQLEEVLKDSIEGIVSLTLDLEKLEYISSAGLRVLLSTQKTMSKQGDMKIAHAGGAIREVFEVTGFSDILVVE